jgi:hypothetical protein
MQTRRTDRPVEIPSAVCTAGTADEAAAPGALHNWIKRDRAIVLAAFLIAATGFLLRKDWHQRRRWLGRGDLRRLERETCRPRSRRVSTRTDLPHLSRRSGSLC